MAGTFSIDLGKFAKKTQLKTNAVIRRLFFDASRRVVMRTRVLSGRARANWIPSIGAMATGTTNALDPQGSATLAAVRGTSKGFVPGTIAYLTNNLPYIRPMEYGEHNFQRIGPTGMVGITMVEMKTIVDDALKETS